MPRIMLLFPNPIATIPGGLTYVAKRFKRNGWETRLHINTFDNFRDADRLKKEIIDPFKPDVVGFSFGTYNLLEVYRLMKECRESGYFVLAGGNHPSILPRESLERGADLVIRGEAELVIDDFTAWYNSGAKENELENIRGISFRNQFGTVVNNKKPRRIRNVDELGFMDFSLLNLDDFRVADGSIKGLNVISAGRGCPFRCAYCSHSDWYAYFHRTADSVLEEMVARNKEYGITQFWLSDETFTVNKDHIYEFCRKFRQEELPFTWSAGTRASAVDENLLREMKRSGLGQLTYGIESADDETLARINKGYDSKLAYEVVTLTGKLGIPMYVNLMTGFPWETPEHVKNNIRFIKQTDRYVNCYQLYGAVIPYPDTPIYWDYHEKEGFTEFWIRPEFQDAGMVIYQNVSNPYLVSTFYQRNLYDDTYVAEDYFFKFTPDYKRAVAKMGHLIGWKAVRGASPSLFHAGLKYGVGRGSHLLYSLAPNLEKQVVGRLIKTNRIHKNRGTGIWVRKKKVDPIASLPEPKDKALPSPLAGEV